MNKQALLLLAALALLAAGAVYFIRSGDGTANPVLEGPTIKGAEAPVAEPAALTPVAAERDSGGRVAAETAEGPGDLPTIAAAGAHPWEPQFAGVTGRLVEADGTPVAGLEVELIEADGNMFSKAVHHALLTDSLIVGRGKSGPGGVFRIRGARGEGFHALIIDPGGGRSTIRLVEQSLSYGKVTALGDVTLDEFGVAIGTVVDEDGEPVAGARVRIAPVPEIVVQVGILDLRKGAMLAFEREQVQVLDIRQKFLDVMDRLPAATGMTDEKGAYRIEGVAKGTVSGGVDRPGYVASTIPTFEMTGAEHDCGEVELLFGRTARGKVVDAAGAPVPDVEVRAGALHPMFSFGLLQTGVVTDESGAFEIPTIPEEGTIIGAARRWEGDAWTLAKAAGSGEYVTIKLEAHAPLHVRLSYEDGTPASEAKFRLRSLDNTRMGMGISTDLAAIAKDACAHPATIEPEPGQYELGKIRVGTWWVETEVDGAAPTYIVVDHAAGAPPVEITLDSGKTINLRVIDSISKEPVEAAHASLVVQGTGLPTAVESGWTNDAGALQLGPFSSQLDTVDGSFQMRLGAPGLVVEKPGYAQNFIALEDLGQPHEEGAQTTIEMLPGGVIVGRVTWAGTPPKDRYMATLVFEDEEFTDVYAPRLAITDAEGLFRIDGLKAGQYQLEIMERFLAGNPLGLMELDHEPVTYASESVVVTAGEETIWSLSLLADGNVPKGWFEGRVLIDGTPPVGGRVRISENEDTYDTLLDGSGSFRSRDFDAMGYQDVQITIQVPDGKGGTEDEDIYHSWDQVPAGKGKEIVLEYQSVPLRVTVLNAVTGEPVEGAFITHMKENNYAQAGPTDESGLASIRLRMEPDDEEATLQVTADGYSETYESVPAKGPPAGLEVRLHPAVKCAGRVILPPTVSDDYLILSPAEEEDPTWCAIEEGGLFTSDELRAGTYRARLYYSMDENGKHITFVLGPNGDTEIVLDFTNL